MPEFSFQEDEMPVTDYRAFFDSRVLRVWHLDGKDKTFTIEKVTRLTTVMKGEEKKQPLIRFKGVPLPFALNKTNGATVEQLYGRNPKNWVGKRLTLYPTQTQVGRNTVDCIRVRNQAPTSKGQPEPTPEPVGDGREPGVD
jgi:hypothetical protein